MKICNICKIEKPFSEFGKNKVRLDGYRYECKECRNASLRTGKPNAGRFQKGDKRPQHSLKMKEKYKKGECTIKPFPKGNVPWNKGKFTTEKKRSRRFKNWSKQVRERDGECKKCGSKENLHAHHILPWKDNEDKRFELKNGMTLCNSCHAKEEGFQKGHIDLAKNKGRKHTEETKRKNSEAHKGKNLGNQNGFKKGQIPWNKGLKKV